MFATIARFAGLGAFGACAGLVGVYAGVVFLTMPSRGSGIDWTNAIVAWIALAGVTAALIVVHVMIGRRLLQLAERPGMRHEL